MLVINRRNKILIDIYYHLITDLREFIRLVHFVMWTILFELLKVQNYIVRAGDNHL